MNRVSPGAEQAQLPNLTYGRSHIRPQPRLHRGTSSPKRSQARRVPLSWPVPATAAAAAAEKDTTLNAR